MQRLRCPKGGPRRTDLRRSDKPRATARNARIFAGSLSPGRCSTPDETSTARGAGNAHRLGQQFRGQAARQHPRPPPVAAGDQLPVEGEPVAAGQRVGPARRLGVEQQQVGDVLVARRGARHPPVAAIAIAFMTGRSKRTLDVGDPLGALAAVELQDVDRRGVEHAAIAASSASTKSADPLHPRRHRGAQSPARAGPTARGLGG